MGNVLTTSKVSPAGLLVPVTKSVLSVAIAIAFGAITPIADAAGLGRLTVHSALGQPLKAEVEVTSLTDREADSLTARLAQPDAFRQAGLEYNPALSGIRFKVDRRSGRRPVVRITSTRPINEPFVDLLVELNWASGKFLREYTFLLDPPELRLGRAEAVQGGTSSVLVTPASEINQQATAAPVTPTVTGSQSPSAKAALAAASAAAATRQQNGKPVLSIGKPAVVAAAPVPRAVAATVAPDLPTARAVSRGDTLGDIARDLKPASVTLNQTMVAIYRKNPSAFFGGIHQLRAGVDLSIPTAAEIAAVTIGDARGEVRASNAAFREYVNRIAEAARVASAPAESAAPTTKTAAGSIAAVAPKPEAVQAVGDKLKLSRDQQGTSNSGSATGSSQAQKSTADIEADIARETALRNAQGRVTELERNVQDLQRLLELKNDQLATLGTQVSDLKLASELTAAQTSTTGDIAPAGENTTAQNQSGDDTRSAAAVTQAVGEAATSAKDEAAKALEEATKAAATDAASGSSASTEAGQINVADASAVADASEAAAGTTQAAAPAAEQAADSSATAPEPVEQAEPSFVDGLASNPYVPIGAAALLAVGGLIAWNRRRRNKSEDRFEDTLGGDDAFAANSLFGTTGGQDVDTSNSLFNTAANGEADADVHSTEVDPIAEAEVYIAYGREAQAEEILKEALKRQPERHAIRLKLLEIFAGRKDAATYSSLAREMYDMTGGQNEEWPKVITMGLAIDPENPLFTGEGEIQDSPATGGDSPTGGTGGSGVQAAAGIGAAAGAAGLIDALATEPAPAYDEPEVAVREPDSVVATADDSESIEADLGSLDFNLDINTESVPTLIGDDDALGEALRSNVELPSLDLSSAGDVASSLSSSLESNTDSIDAIAGIEDLNVEIPSIDTMSGPASPEADVDLSSIGLDLTTASATEAPASAETSRWQEMATKLDLASAYEEIGDKEGARELLEEVIQGGDNSQQQKARAMLSKIS